MSGVCLATEIAEGLDAESLLGSCVWSILEGEIAENGSAGQGSAKTIHSEANQLQEKQRAADVPAGEVERYGQMESRKMIHIKDEQR